ncbi:hypothetical protein TUM4249_12550 [Shewanella sp. KT0246]|nr:hypothetical protein TUM4249_12550 [Shewanella sp. KT0246]
MQGRTQAKFEAAINTIRLTGYPALISIYVNNELLNSMKDLTHSRINPNTIKVELVFAREVDVIINNYVSI